jgi:hypothetical protein
MVAVLSTSCSASYGPLHLDNQLRHGSCLSVLCLIHGTRFAQVDFEPEPRRLALFACAGLGVRGGTNDPFVFLGWRARSPLGFPARQVVILLPDLAQESDTGLLLEDVGSIRLFECLQPMQSVRTNLLRQGGALAFGGWRKRSFSTRWLERSKQSGLICFTSQSGARAKRLIQSRS